MKKKTWMKCIASCLTFVLLVTMVPVQAAANTEKEGGTGTPEVLLRLRRRLQLQQQVRRRLQQQVRRRLQQPQ